MLSIKLSFLQISPKVWSDDNHLYARTAKVYRLLCLFFYSRTVIIDRIKKHIEVKTKAYWFVTSKRYIPFNDIKYIDVAKIETMSLILRTGATPETWYVQIVRKNKPFRELLFTFNGDGGADETYDYLPFFDFTGMQYEKALSYAELVSKYTGAQLFRDTKIEYNIKVDHYKCLKCGHISPSKTRCMYCGSPEMEKFTI
ncbi:MAG: zinc ribbon domain-containing protein [Deltaproteobacteria bacterium]|nr:zinc ribbon domain-containing protein [Deltaproteobacteria bacterium]